MESAEGWTRRKLEEAQFFLGKMREDYPKNPTFDHYLSAFIGAARSVRWVMKHEYVACPGWKEWSAAKEKEVEKDFLTRLAEVRNRSQKVEPISTALRVELELQRVTEEDREWLESLFGSRVKVEIGTGDEPTAEEEGQAGSRSRQFQARLVQVYRFLTEFLQEDIVAICERYFLLLQKWVEECTVLFSGPASEPTV